MKLGSLSASSVTLYGQNQSVFVRSTLANPDLAPERTRESEFGIDATVVRNVVVGLTWYSRRTLDQLQNLGNPTGLMPIWANTTSIAAHGFEATVTVPIVNTPAIHGDLLFAYSYGTDRLLGLGAVTGTSYRVGYPIEAVFGKPILAVLDTIGGHADGIVFPQEVVRDTASRFLGVSIAPRTYTLTPTATLLGGHLRLSALFDRQSGLLVFNSYPMQCIYNGLCLGAFLKTAPLREQAKYAQGYTLLWDFYVPGDFTRWREANVTVDLPSRILHFVHFSHGEVSLQGRNLLLWTKYSGTDPESRNLGPISPEANGIPQARTWAVRFDVTP